MANEQAGAAGTPAEAAKTETPAAGTPAADGKAAEAGKAAETGTATDSKAAGAEPGSKAGGETPPEPKAPEKYELAIPESGKAFADDGTLKQIETIARANKWSNEDAQAALDEHLALVQAQATRYETETKADPDYGGAKFEETQRLARKVIDRVRPTGHTRRDSFLTFLGRGGAGNHIEVISFLADLGKQMGEDTPSHARSSGQGVKDGAAKLYDHPDSRKLEEQTKG
jgi:hypothetical protein